VQQTRTSTTFRVKHTPWNKGKKTGVGGPKGRKWTTEERQRSSEVRKGQTPWNKGKTGIGVWSSQRRKQHTEKMKKRWAVSLQTRDEKLSVSMKKVLSTVDYTFISHYRGMTGKWPLVRIIYKCTKGHKIDASWPAVKRAIEIRGSNCRLCSIQVKREHPFPGRIHIKPFSTYALLFKEAGATLLSIEYNPKKEFHYVCRCGKRCKTTHYQRYQCRECGNKAGAQKNREFIRPIGLAAPGHLGQKRASRLEQLQAEFLAAGCKITKYVNCKRMYYICSCGGFGVSTLWNWRRGARCSKCSSRRQGKQKSFKEILATFLKAGCVPLFDQYLNAHDPLRFRCRCGRIAQKGFQMFEHHPHCIHCGREIQAQQGQRITKIRKFYQEAITKINVSRELKRVLKGVKKMGP
jgi:hypothetical protein